MVVTKHKAVHGVSYRTKTIKYILNPDKTQELELVSDFGMLGELDWKIYEDYVDFYQWNFEINDERYNRFDDRLFEKNNKIHAHHIIQSFSPDDNLTPEEINRIGWEVAKEFTGGKFRFIVATHVDKDHIHNHILINAIDLQSEKKFKWDRKRYRDFKQISDRISKIAGAKIVEPNRFSYSDYKMYKQSSHKYELKQRINFLLRHSKSMEDFFKNAEALSIKIDFSGKHTTYRMTDRDMKKNIRADKINKREVYNRDFYQTYFAKQDIQRRVEFLLKHSTDFQDFVRKAEKLDLLVKMKTRTIDFCLSGGDTEIVINSENLSKKFDYDQPFFEDYFSKIDIQNDNLLPIDEVAAEFQEFENMMDTSISTEEILSQYQQEKVQEEEKDLFEVELEEWQIEKEVNDGLYIKVWFGLDSEGLVFIPNSHLEIETTPDLEKRYRLFLDEKKYYYLYNKDNSDANRFVMGKTLIKQLSGERQKVPHRKIITENTLKEKMEQINLLIGLRVQERSYNDIKQELIEKIALSELKMTELNQKIETLNQVAELLAGCDSDDSEIQRRSRMELAKLNVSVHLTYEQVEEQIRELQDELYKAVGDYESVTRQMETYIDLLKKYNSESNDREKDEKQHGPEL
ncbi:SAG1250 family conjugative relaxase [Streptococcus suis]|uniref:SAG1250 family conjugative relaxase n=1 Tax=Streptococcus suis TaxID=1307 RepID=UPI00041D8809|nr:SAG1250 family conjugative relaxase [Streptococcus suis]HEM3179829.1 relaxase/mobilization nuclease domain-containing protein [Streptococcus suis 92-4172]